MKQDARKLHPSAQEEKRRLGIKLWKKGYLIKEVAETVGVSSKAVSNWVKRYKSEGASSLTSRTRGVRIGTNRQLSLDQLRINLNWITRCGHGRR